MWVHGDEKLTDNLTCRYLLRVYNFSADVLACNLNPETNMIEVLDTWNQATGRSNLNDDVMDTFLFSGTSDSGRITCM